MKTGLSILLLLTACSQAPDGDLSALLDAMEYVESGGRADAVGDDGRAVGILQIWKIYVDDVNRICANAGLEYRFTYEDRLSKWKSRAMVRVYFLHYVGRNLGEDDFERCARVHNGGPKGHKKDCTIAYWDKVKARLEWKTQ